MSEVVDTQPAANLRLRYGTLLPQHFQVGNYRGDWRQWTINLGQKVGFDSSPNVVATATNHNVRVHSTATVEVVAGIQKTSFGLTARNSDVAAGVTNYNYLAVQRGVSAATLPDNLMIDSGRVTPRAFAPTGMAGDWQVWAVAFNEPYAAPPVVLCTADNFDGNLGSYARAAVPCVFDTSTDGFILAARSSDTSGGPVAFGWVAVGIGLYRL